MTSRNFAQPGIQRMKPYTLPLRGRSHFDGLLLDYNERSRPLSPNVHAAIVKAVDRVNRYPEYPFIQDRIAAYAGVASSQIMITNGSDQALDSVFRTFTTPGSTAIIPTPSFRMYSQYAQLADAKLLQPLYRQTDMAFPLSEVLAAIDDSVTIIVISNPNNPTGTLVGLAAIEEIAAAAPQAIVLVDEAYFEFSGLTAVGLMSRYPNLIVTRTFSKAFGLAALRIGYVVANPKNILEMQKVHSPYDVNALAGVGAVATLEDLSAMKSYVQEVGQARLLVERYFQDRRIPHYPSAANFILFRPDNALVTFEALKHYGVLVRQQAGDSLEGCLRVTIGTIAEMQQFIEIYNQAMPDKV